MISKYKCIASFGDIRVFYKNNIYEINDVPHMIGNTMWHKAETHDDYSGGGNVNPMALREYFIKEAKG